MESAPSRGTTLRLNVPLPIANPDDVEAADGVALGGAPLLLRRAQPSREVAERDGSLLLLAEDHPINRRVLVHQLGIIGFHVDAAEDGAQALERFVTGRYGLVLTDLNMPVMDGFELAGAIRQREAEAGLPRIPILALSANVVQGEAERCIGAGMDDFVGKPAPMPVLAEKLRRWMSQIRWTEAATGDGSGAVPGPPEDEVVIDRSVLDELTGGDDDPAAAILVDYVNSSRSDLTALRAAVDGGSADEVRSEAHRIKGASRMVGAQQVSTLAAQLEVAAATIDDRSALVPPPRIWRRPWPG